MRYATYAPRDGIFAALYNCKRDRRGASASCQCSKGCRTVSATSTIHFTAPANKSPAACVGFETEEIICMSDFAASRRTVPGGAALGVAAAGASTRSMAQSAAAQLPGQSRRRG